MAFGDDGVLEEPAQTPLDFDVDDADDDDDPILQPFWLSVVRPPRAFATAAAAASLAARSLARMVAVPAALKELLFLGWSLELAPSQFLRSRPLHQRRPLRDFQGHSDPAGSGPGRFRRQK